jgi:hypothetical protein
MSNGIVDDSLHLTMGQDPVLAKQIAQSRPGMAHFAATGPFGATCKDCTYWQKLEGKEGGKEKLRCAKYKQLTGHLGPPVAGKIEACRYFERADEK